MLTCRCLRIEPDKWLHVGLIWDPYRKPNETKGKAKNAKELLKEQPKGTPKEIQKKTKGNQRKPTTLKHGQGLKNMAGTSQNVQTASQRCNTIKVVRTFFLFARAHFLTKMIYQVKVVTPLPPCRRGRLRKDLGGT